MSQENLKFGKDSDDETNGNEMTVNMLDNKFGDIAADDDEGGHNLTQYNRHNMSQVGDNSDLEDKTESEQSNEMEENRINTLKQAPIQTASLFKKYLLWSSQYKVMSKEQTDAE